MRGYTGGVHTKRELPGCSPTGRMCKGLFIREIPNFSTFGIGPAAAGGATLLVYELEAGAKYYYKKYRSAKHVASQSLNNYENSYDG